MYKKVPGIIVFILCLLFALYNFTILQSGTVAANDVITRNEPETTSEINTEGPTDNFTVSNLVISPISVKPSEIVSISVNVTNIGVVSGNYVLTLKINDVIEGEIRVTLDPEVTETFTFTLTGQSSGQYSVDVNGLKGNYVVTEPPPPITETTTPPPTTKIITQTPSGNQSSSTTIMLEGPPPEEGPLSWWLITIIVVGGLVIILVTWRLVRRAS